MNFFRSALFVFALLLLLSFALPGQAHAKKPAAPAPPPDTRTVVQTVNAAQGTVVLLNHKDHNRTRSYKVDDRTKLTINNSPGTVAQIKAGMVVTDMMERDSTTIDSMTLSGYGEDPKPPAAAKKKN